MVREDKATLKFRAIMVVKPLIPTRTFVVLEEWPCTVQFYQLLVSCWFGIWSWYPQNNGPFHKGFLQFQTKNPNQQWTIRWRRNRWITQLLPDTCPYMQNVCFVSNDQLSIKQWRTLYIYINIYFLRMHKTQKKHIQRTCLFDLETNTVEPY